MIKSSLLTIAGVAGIGALKSISTAGNKNQDNEIYVIQVHGIPPNFTNMEPNNYSVNIYRENFLVYLKEMIDFIDQNFQEKDFIKKFMYKFYIGDDSFQRLIRLLQAIHKNRRQKFEPMEIIIPENEMENVIGATFIIPRNDEYMHYTSVENPDLFNFHIVLDIKNKWIQKNSLKDTFRRLLFHIVELYSEKINNEQKENHPSPEWYFSKGRITADLFFDPVNGNLKDAILRGLTPTDPKIPRLREF